MQEKKELSISEYLDAKIAFHKDVINKQLGAIEALTEFKNNLVRSNEQEQTKEAEAGAEAGAASRPSSNGYAYKETGAEGADR